MQALNCALAASVRNIIITNINSLKLSRILFPSGMELVSYLGVKTNPKIIVHTVQLFCIRGTAREKVSCDCHTVVT